MFDVKNIKINDYSYYLPQEKIAKYPLKERDKSKLLIYKDNKIKADNFFNIHQYLPEDSLLVLNNTKVIYARLNFRKITGAKIEIFCLNPYSPAAYEEAFEAKNTAVWTCLVGNLKKWKNGRLSMNFNHNGQNCILQATYMRQHGNNHLIKFDWNCDLTFGEILDIVGNIPIPPYLQRQAEDKDKITYQTVFSKIKGSVAAPTAGLHFTDKVFSNINKKNIKITELTLHVGAGTFKPVKSEIIGNHEMHTEIFTISREALTDLIEKLGKITSVGTTVMRTLESLYWCGYKLYYNLSDFDFVKQWEIYEFRKKLPPKRALKALVDYIDKRKQKAFFGKTQIIIVPGYHFKITNNLITNFHQPNSTLLLLVAAFTGQDWKKIYDFALKKNFRFLSYGDSSLLFGKKKNFDKF